MMSYFSFLFILPLIFCPDDKFACYHAKQGMALFIFGIIADIVSSLIPVLSPLFMVFRIYCIIKGVRNANSGIMEPLPYIGKYAER